MAPELRQAAFEWFIDVRGGLKGRLPRKVFRLKCLELFERWKEANGAGDATFMCSDKWISDWMSEYRVSLKHPNKRFALSQVERVLRIQEFLKNLLRVRYFFIHNYKKEPIIINGDQMPLHRNENAGQKTLSMCDETTYVKENYLLSRERVTVFTQVSTSTGEPLLPEFVFKGKGIRIHLQPPQGVHVQFAPKGSYRLDTMLQTISHFRNRSNPFSCANFAIYILDDYSVHVTDEVRKAMLARGYILICIGGGVTGDVQVNDTHYHHALKKEYREKEAALMLKQLEENPHKVPSPSRDDMMRMLCQSWEALEVDPVMALKSLFILNALDGSEDYLVSDKMFELIGRDLVDFRQKMLQTPPLKTVQDLVKAITLPKGVRRKGDGNQAGNQQNQVPQDEGIELLDCEGDELNEQDVAVELNYQEDAENDVLAAPGLSVEKDTASNKTTMSSPMPSAAASSSSCSRTVALAPVAEGSTDDKSDAEFLDKMKDLLENHTTSALFIPHYLQLKMAYTKARKSLKKRILSNRELLAKISSEAEDNSKEMPSTSTTAQDDDTEQQEL